MENTFGFEVIRDPRALTTYLEKISLEEGKPMELRYIAYTAMNGEQSFIARIPNKGLHCELLVPHTLEDGGIQKRLIRKHQDLHELIRKGLQKEANLEMRRFKSIRTLIVQNTNSLVTKDTHDKHLVVILRYKKYDWHAKDFEPLDKNYIPVWVHESLIKDLFEPPMMTDGTQRLHTQHQVYAAFNRT